MHHSGFIHPMTTLILKIDLTLTNTFVLARHWARVPENFGAIKVNVIVYCVVSGVFLQGNSLCRTCARLLACLLRSLKTRVASDRRLTNSSLLSAQRNRLGWVFDLIIRAKCHLTMFFYIHIKFFGHMILTCWIKIRFLAAPTWLWGRCGRHNSPPASSVMGLVFRRSDGSHGSVDTVHPSLLRNQNPLSVRHKSLSNFVLMPKKKMAAKNENSRSRLCTRIWSTYEVICFASDQTSGVIKLFGLHHTRCLLVQSWRKTSMIATKVTANIQNSTCTIVSASVALKPYILFHIHMYNVITSNINSNDCLQVIMLPSQVCAFKVKVTETSIVTAADVVTMRGKRVPQPLHIHFKRGNASQVLIAFDGS